VTCLQMGNEDRMGIAPGAGLEDILIIAHHQGVRKSNDEERWVVS
jgi:hypothetical protein